MTDEDDPGRMKRRTIWIPDVLWCAAKDKARRQGASNSHVIRRLLTNWTKR